MNGNTSERKKAICERFIKAVLEARVAQRPFLKQGKAR